MSVIPEQNDVLKSVGSFIGEQAINATAIASAIIVLRSGIRDPKIIAGAFALYVVPIFMLIIKKINFRRG